MTAPAVGLVGCGAWGRLILRDLVALGARVAVAATGDHARVAAQAGARTVVANLRDLPDADGLVVATPTSTHAAVIEALLPRGVPIFCEKPLCDDASRARSLAETGAGRLFVMDKWRYHGGVLALASIARSGELGPVVGLRTTRLGWGHDYADVDCIWTLLPHDLSIALEILGRLPEPRCAVADRGATGPAGMTALSRSPGAPWHIAEVGIRSPDRQRTVALYCRDGRAVLSDSLADHLVVTDSPPANGRATPPRVVRRPIPTDMPLLAELAAFLDHLNGGPPPKSPVADAAAIVEAIAALRRLAGL